MQTCFRDHPDVYGAELEPDDEDYEPEAVEGDGVPGDRAPEVTPAHANARTSASLDDSASGGGSPAASSPSESSTSTDRAKAAAEEVRLRHGPQSETEELVPMAAHNATGVASRGEK